MAYDVRVGLADGDPVDGGGEFTRRALPGTVFVPLPKSAVPTASSQDTSGT